jgi:hypothetical protein
MEIEKKRKRGRPAGVKDSKPRQYRSHRNGDEHSGPLLTVEEQVRRMTGPARISTYASFCGLSKATLRKKVEQGKIRGVFKRSGIILIEPKDFLEYWLGGKVWLGLDDVQGRLE